MNAWTKGFAATALLICLGTGTMAQAGEALRFKQGIIRTSDLASTPNWFQYSLANPAGRYYVVQFKSHIAEIEHRALLSAHAQEMRYVPDDALIVRIDTVGAARGLSTLPSVRTVVPYGARWKLSPELSPSVFSARDNVELLVRIFSELERDEISARIAALPEAQVERADGKSIVVRAAISSLPRLVEIDGVEWAQTLPEIVTFDARLGSDLGSDLGNDLGNGDGSRADGDYSDLDGYESGTKAMKFDAAYARGYDGAGQVGSMADTGLDTGDKSTLFTDFKGRVRSGYALGLFGETWSDPMGHGTHVAGSVIGSGAGSAGRIRGGAYAADFVAESLWSPMLGGLAMPSKISTLFDKAKADGASVHTNSWGSPRNLGAYDGYAQQVDEWAFHNQDLLILFAAGNSGVDKGKTGRIESGSVSSPGTAKNCLTVGASKNLVSKFGYQKKMSELRGGSENWAAEPIASSKLSDNLDGMAAFSSRGPTQDGRLKPEVVAPGTNILSNRAHTKEAEPLWGAYNADYVWSGGTSMATPLAAGAALVARQYLINGRKIENPSAALLKATLMHTAHDIFPGGFGAIGKEHGQEILTTRPTTDAGYGRVDMDAATSMADAQLFDEKSGVTVGETRSYRANSSTAGTLTATLAWIDAPGADSAAKALVNDLDLSVIDSTGRESSLRDTTNNTEMIEIPVGPGAYEIRVKGANVPQGIGGKQPYALIVSVK